MNAHNAPPFTLHRGTRALLLSLPHVGTELPDEVRDALLPRAHALEDTDWHLERLYDFARELGVSVLVPRFGRYAVDLNRPPENAPMYPGANNTELCPTRFFTGESLYRDGCAPDAAQVHTRVQRWWCPYHEALQAELARLKALHGHVVLFDGHSIKSELPWLFPGRLWDLNLGTADGRSCDAGLRAALVDVLAAQDRFTHIADGRFRGGYITRQYGQPADGVHAVQLEMTWRSYMDENPPWAWDEARAAGVRPVLRALMQAMLDWRPRS